MPSNSNLDGSRGSEFSALMVSKLAHDLRMLLTVIVNCVESIRAEMPPDGASDTHFAELDGAIDSAFYVSRELLAMGERKTLERGIVELNELVAQARGVITRIIGQDTGLSLRLMARLPFVRADAVELEWLLLNLAANARDAMPEGGVLTIETTTVDAWSQDVATGTPRPLQYVRLAVTDTGHGMTPETRSKAFEPFFTTKEGETGLGLTSVAVTVRSLKGWLHVLDNEPRGTQVHVYLPVLSAPGH